jgi:hypothetical protein
MSLFRAKPQDFASPYPAKSSSRGTSYETGAASPRAAITLSLAMQADAVVPRRTARAIRGGLSIAASASSTGGQLLQPVVAQMTRMTSRPRSGAMSIVASAASTSGAGNKVGSGQMPIALPPPDKCTVSTSPDASGFPDRSTVVRTK